MSNGFRANTTVMHEGEILIVQESNLLSTTARTLDGSETVTGETERFERFDIPTAL